MVGWTCFEFISVFLLPELLHRIGMDAEGEANRACYLDAVRDGENRRITPYSIVLGDDVGNVEFFNS